MPSSVVCVTMLPYWYRVFSSHLFWRQQQKSPSIPGETCTTRCSVSRGLHLFSVFSVQLEPTGVAQEEVYTGDFFFFFFSFCPTASCGACLHFCARRVRPHISREHQRRILSTHGAFSAITSLPTKEGDWRVFGMDSSVWTVAAKKVDGVPWHKGMIKRGAERCMAAWQRKREEKSQHRAIDRDGHG